MFLFTFRSAGKSSHCSLSARLFSVPQLKHTLRAHVKAQHSFSTISSDSTSPLYKIAKIKKDGTLTYTSLTIVDILRGSSMHARDLFSLNLTPSSNYDDYFDSVNNMKMRKRGDRLLTGSSAAILPRENDIIVSFGTIRAQIGFDSGIIFDAHKPAIQLLANEMSATVVKSIHENSEEKQENEQQKGNVSSDNQDYFELVFLEEILRDVTNTYARRLTLYEPIVNSVLSKVTNEMFTATVIHRIVPIKDSILEFEIQVQSALDSLKDLLMNDEDMVGLLLTKKREAKENGYDLDVSSHEVVELLIEEYARRLNTILNETRYLLKKVDSKQELIAISLASYRNIMIRMNVYLGITGIGVGSATAVAGFFGMNLISGLEDSPTAFANVVLITTSIGILIGAGCVSFISGSSMRKRTFKRVKEITLIDNALSRMNSVDYAIKYMVHNNERLTKEQFMKRIYESHPNTRVDNEEVELLFNAFDITKDDLVYIDDFQSFGRSTVDTYHENKVSVGKTS